MRTIKAALLSGDSIIEGPQGPAASHTEGSPMKFVFGAIALVPALALVLSACGGGGGGGGGGTTGVTPQPTQALSINETNAKPVSANALDTAQNTSATGGVASPLGVQVDAGNGSAPTLQAIAEAARFASSAFAASTLPRGVAINRSNVCPMGGSITINGNVAGSTGFSAGDSFTLTMANCGMQLDASTAVMNGSITMTVAAGSLTDVPFHVVLAVTVTNLSVTTGGVSVVTNGDTRLDWTSNSITSETLIASGNSMSTRETINGATHTTTVSNFSQTLVINGNTNTSTMSGTVETDSSKLGSGVVSYTISTPTPVSWDSTTNRATAGVIKVVGANNSQVLVTINGDSSVTIQLDANGDGVYEKTITSTTAELAGLV
jgi:hypothetical protein